MELLNVDCMGLFVSFLMVGFDFVDLDFGLFHNLCLDTERKNLSTESLKFDLLMGLHVIIVLHFLHGMILEVLDNKYCVRHVV